MKIGGVFTTLDISASALSVQRRRMDTTARNLANVNTTRTEEGGPYRRESVAVSELKPKGLFGAMLDKATLRLNRTEFSHLKSSYFMRRNEIEAGGAQIDEILEDDAAPKLVYDPHHPDADEEGYVRMPNINIITEMVNIIGATRAYEANLTVVDSAKNIFKKSLEI